MELKKVRNSTVLGFKFSLLADKNHTEGQDGYVGLILAKKRRLDVDMSDSILIICHHNKVNIKILSLTKYL